MPPSLRTMAVIEKWLPDFVTNLFVNSLVLEFHLKYLISVQKLLIIFGILIAFGFTLIGLVLSIDLLIIFSPVIVPAALLGCIALLPLFALMAFSILFLLVLHYINVGMKTRADEGTSAEITHVGTLKKNRKSKEIMHNDGEGTSAAIEDKQQNEEIEDEGTCRRRLAIIKPEQEAIEAKDVQLKLKITPMECPSTEGIETSVLKQETHRYMCNGKSTLTVTGKQDMATQITEQKEGRNAVSFISL